MKHINTARRLPRKVDIYMDLYSAMSLLLHTGCSDNGSHSFTCKLRHAYLYFPAAEHHRTLAGTHFTVPRRVEG